MANVRINRRTNRGPWGGLPPICTRCGEPAVLLRERVFSWTPPVGYLLLLGGLPGILVLILVLVKKARLQLPFCKRHRNPWLWRAVLHYGGVGVFGMGCLASIVIMNIADSMGKRGEDLAGFVCASFGIGALLWLITIIVFEIFTIRAGEITDSSVTLTAVSPRFRDAVIAARNPAPYAVEIEEEELLPEVDEPVSVAPTTSPSPIASAAAQNKLCPYCSEEIKATAIKCRFCGEFLD